MYNISETLILIETLTNNFENLYNKIYPSQNGFEDANILGNGYCLYFANLLVQLLPEGHIINTPFSHYIFEYDGHYYDYRGLLGLNNNIVEVYPGQNFIVTPNLIVFNPEEEMNYGEIYGVTDKYRDKVWEMCEPLLLQLGQEYLQNIRNNKEDIAKR